LEVTIWHEETSVLLLRAHKSATPAEMLGTADLVMLTEWMSMFRNYSACPSKPRSSYDCKSTPLFQKTQQCILLATARSFWCTHTHRSREIALNHCCLDKICWQIYLWINHLQLFVPKKAHSASRGVSTQRIGTLPRSMTC
jgi:hypothetical protein